ncbi:MAG: biotin/lipoyl-binding protein [Verrucomicrobiae bacterium]|nr:biotin/lipoyl-binding protein [Verrucomicrobiae bacterium]
MAADHRVSEIAASRPRLRRDLRTHYQDYRGSHTYVIEDTGRGRFFQLGLPEYQFVQSFDGHTTFAEALARSAATQGADALTEAQADQLLRWLVDNELLESGSGSQGQRHLDHHREKDARRPRNLLSKVFFFKIPLGCPDRLISLSEKRLGWVFALPGFLLWVALVGFTATRAAPHWDRFLSGAGQVIAPEGWIYLAAGYALLKVFHEFAHGLATRRFGGAVPEWGVQMLAFVTPLAYVDASASTRFPSKWQRILVSAAGMYVESALACLCLLGWISTGPGVWNSTLHGAVIAATLVTVLFNLNPLMRFDGYYILCDLLGIPNLGTKGQQWLVWFGKRYLLGMKELELPQSARLHPVAVPLYGVLAAIWRVLVWIGITVIVSLLFKGAGLFLALLSIVAAVGTLLYKLVRFLFKPGSGPSLSRAVPRLATLVVLVASALFLIRVNPTGKALAVVEYEDETRVRAGLKALVTEVAVKDGDTVSEGDLIARLSNPDEESARDQLALELAAARVRARSYYQAGDLAAHQAEQEIIRGLETKLAEGDRYLAGLEVVAPVAGRIIGRHLDSLPGRWVVPGEEIVIVAGGKGKEWVLSIRQEDIEAVAGMVGREIRVRLRGRPGEWAGILDRIESRATTAIPHPALVSVNGGPLPLLAQADAAGERENELATQAGGQRGRPGNFSGLELPETLQELAVPRFLARARVIDSGEGEDWLAGEWGYVRFGGVESARLGSWIHGEIRRYLREKLDHAKKASSQGI